jgi:protein-L-isoaspartate(D-aspartate) O-methyltransferase
MLNIEQARFNMIEQQIRPWDVLDSKILELMAAIPREAFVPAGYEGLAYADTEIPLGRGQVMLSPKVVGRMLQAANIDPLDIALEVGTGSGYQTALLARGCRQVFSIDIDARNSAQARKNIDSQGINNATLEVGDAARGWDQSAPYDVIIINGSLPVLPETFQKSLNRGGRLVAIVGDAPVMEAILITRTGDNEWSRESLFETSIPPLINASQPQRFTF